ncbi:HLA class II histocompatibility antigen, DR alpha chain-like [Acanthochromis polyacanthus]|uniref:HLA class II histocompatibility antigen, DR alpha chain-like n=1 Tax=Acanthochromis polyacanthus TaxID=80966 RepID=UPI002234E3F9|nr:HLA class II histocompatibility antigen, DR alpha chain-like [Acanthochromis polyacanthus]
MKMSKLLLVLCCILGVSANVLHEGGQIGGCSDSEGAMMYTLEDEELWYADFKSGRGVAPQPDFIDHISFNPGTYEQAVAEQQICRANLQTCQQAMKDLPVEKDPPEIPMIYIRDTLELKVKNTLICHVSGFYPAPVKVSWIKNGKNVTEGSSINVPFPNKDGSFTQISRLEFIPQLGDIYSCSVEHVSLDEPLTAMWDVTMTPPSVGPLVFCGAGLTVGLLGVAVGIFFFIKGHKRS